MLRDLVLKLETDEVLNQLKTDQALQEFYHQRIFEVISDSVDNYILTIRFKL